MVSFFFSKSARGTRFDIHLTKLWTFICCCCYCSQLSTKRRGASLARSTLWVIFIFSWTLFFTAFASPASFPSKTPKRIFQLSPDGSYMFSYDTGPGQHQSFREERRTTHGSVAGKYGYVDPKGVLRITEYVADSKGYRASLEVYEPIHHFPSSPPLIVGPLPIPKDEKEKKKSVFEKYAFPIEPFESMKVPLQPAIDSNSIVDSKVRDNLNVTVKDPMKRLPKEDVKKDNADTFADVTDDSTPESSNDTSLPTVDISTLQDELQLLSLRLKDDPLLIIGPLPKEFDEVNELSFQRPRKDLADSFMSDSKKTETNFLHDGARSLRSPLSNSLSKANHQPSDDSSFRKVIPSLSDLNFVERRMVLNGEKLSSFMALPSSNLLQGNFVTLNQTRGKSLPSRRQVRVKKRRLNTKPKNLVMDRKLSNSSSTNNTSSVTRSLKNLSEEVAKKGLHDEKTMKLISFQARNIFMELLKLNPRSNIDVALLKSSKISKAVKKKNKELSSTNSGEESNAREK